MFAIKKIYHPYIVIVILALVSIVFHFKTINQFPQYRHCWAQSDRYAIALGFIDNGGDFFHPQTFVYNKQFPDDFEKVYDNTITSVDFPVHDYIVSLFMRLLHTSSPWVFKLYMMLYSLVGFFYLFKLSSLFTSSFSKQLAVMLFALSSSTVLYYQAGFLPTIASLANAFIGLYFYFKSIRKNELKYFYVSMFFFALAALARLPFSIILIAITSIEFLKFCIQKKIIWQKVWALLLVFFIIAVYFQYNNYLRESYGSLFLNYIIPADSVETFLDYIVTVYERWGLQYFTIFHYLALGILILIFIALRFFKKLLSTIIDNQLISFVLITLVGCSLYYLLMAFQFLNHDYYFLDTFYLPIVLLFLFLLIKIPVIKQSIFKWIINSSCLIIFIPMFMYSYNTIEKEKQNDFYKQATTAESFANSDALLKELGIPTNAKILCMGTDGVNNPFILMNRKGYTVISTWQPHKIEMALNWPFDAVVLENTRLVNGLYSNYPNIIQHLIKIGGNDLLSVYVKNNNHQKVSMDNFFGLTKSNFFYSQSINFDSIPTNNFSNLKVTQDVLDNKNKVGYADSLSEYSLEHTIKNIELKSKIPLLKVKANYYTLKVLRECLICVSIKHDNEQISFLAIDLAKENIKPKQWTSNELLFALPNTTPHNSEIVVFIWNKGKNNVYFDDINYSIY